MLEGRNVNLRSMEKEEPSLLAEWMNCLEFQGEYLPLRQISRSEAEKMFENPFEMTAFIIEKKDERKIGFIAHFYVLHPSGRQLEMGYALVPSERGKGYCTEAAKIMVDYLFLSKDTCVFKPLLTQEMWLLRRFLRKLGFRRKEQFVNPFSSKEN